MTRSAIELSVAWPRLAVQAVLRFRPKRPRSNERGRQEEERQRRCVSRYERGERGLTKGNALPQAAKAEGEAAPNEIDGTRLDGLPQPLGVVRLQTPQLVERHVLLRQNRERLVPRRSLPGLSNACAWSVPR